MYSDKMKTWLVWQDSNNEEDTYQSFVCSAETEYDARHMYPHNNPRFFWKDNTWCYYWENVLYTDKGSEWVSPDKVVVEFLGESNKRQAEVICADFRPSRIWYGK